MQWRSNGGTEADNSSPPWAALSTLRYWAYLLSSDAWWSVWQHFWSVSY